jgi:Ca2+:H+ antiporter
MPFDPPIIQTVIFPLFIDLGATFLFSITGAMVGIRRHYDFIGLFVLALACGLGGGLLRDGIFIQNGPPAAMLDGSYIIAAAGGCIIAGLFYNQVERLSKPFLIFDSLGTGAYGVVGASKAFDAHLSVPACIFVGVINAAGSGLIRDILVREEPLMLKPGQYYVIASLLGVTSFALFTRYFHIPLVPSASAAIAITFSLRLLAIHFDWRTQAVMRPPPASSTLADERERPRMNPSHSTPIAMKLMMPLLKQIRHNPLLWLLAFVPLVFVFHTLYPESHTLLFILSVLAIVPLAALLSHATEAVAAKTGDAVGGLLNATLGNLTELVIALTALRAGQYMLVKASIAGAIVTNTLFMLGASFLLGGLKYHVQEFNRVGARFQAGLLFLAIVALLIPSAVSQADSLAGAAFTQKLSVGLAVLLIVAYALGMLFSLKTHREVFASAEHPDDDEAPWPMGLALATLAGVTVLVALVSEVFVESVQKAAETFGMSAAFVGFIVVALVGGAAEMASAFSGARKNRLDLSVGIALGSASQIALFVAPVLVLLSYVLGPTPMNLQFWPGAVVMMLIATMTASLVTNSGRSAWFVGVLLLMVYLIFAMTLYLLPPQTR